MKAFGWKKSPYDRRDHLHSYKVATPAQLPSKVDLSTYIPECRSQGPEGSCVGFGLGGNLTATAKKLGLTTEWFSPRDIYNGARYIEGALTREGADPRDGCSWLVNRGALLESLWPYQANKDSQQVPSSSLDPERVKHPVLRYKRVINGVNGLQVALAEGNLVSFGSAWFDSWMEGSVLPEVSKDSTVAGGHETYLYGYDADTGFLFGANSWGNYNDQQGRYMMPFSAVDVFKSFGGYDAHIFTVEWTTA